VKIPVSVDIETGYSENVNQVISNIEKLYYAGVVGINIEDSQQGKLNQVNAFSEKLNVIKKNCEKQNMKMFVNARTDSFLLRLPNPVENTLERIKVYQNAGVDGIFVPFVSEEDAIRKIVAATSLPVNVLYSPKLPSYETLRQLGVSRISMGTFLFKSVYKNLETFTRYNYEETSFSGAVVPN